MRTAALLILSLMLSTTALADDDGVPRRGLSVFANAGAIWADDNSANFFSGRPENANTIDRVLHSETYGTRIWQDLKNAGLISSAIGNYSQLTVSEYANMYYRTSFNLGLGIRYDYSSGLGWLLRFNMWRLRAAGAFNLSSDNGTGILSDNHQYIRCGMMGKEDRINIEFGLAYTFDLSDGLCLEIDLGGGFNNTKVRENLMEIHGATYSILDVWNGQSPSSYSGSYEYVNQGGLGWNLFGSAFLGYRVEAVGAIKVGYTLTRSTVTHKKDNAGAGWSHCIDLRLEINNFSFF